MVPFPRHKSNLSYYLKIILNVSMMAPVQSLKRMQGGQI